MTAAIVARMALRLRRRLRLLSAPPWTLLLLLFLLFLLLQLLLHLRR